MGFVPTHESVVEGRKIKKAIESVWTPPSNYFHLRPGGHVEALRAHLSHSHFLRIDLRNFFGSINRSGVTRCLKEYFGYATARAYANSSTVASPTDDGFIVPFGFVQSQIVAALCFSKSALGLYLDKLSSSTSTAVTVYVDDIVISSSDSTLLDHILLKIKNAATRSRFELNADKQQGPSSVITAFNILLATRSMEVSPERMRKFHLALDEAATNNQRAGIKSYVTSVNAVQGGGIMLRTA